MKKIVEKFSRIDVLILALILVIAFAARLYKIDKPLTDYHSWRQADTAAVARNFARDGFNLLMPRYDDLSSIQSGKDNPQGLRFVEFPVYNAVIAAAYKIYPGYEIHVWGRIISTLSSLIIIGIVYYLLRQEVGRTAAIAGSLTFSVFPYMVYFSRAVLPETMAVMFTFVSILLLYQFAFGEKRSPLVDFLTALFAAVAFALALLIKPTVIFFGLVHVYLLYKRFDLGFLKYYGTYLFGLIAFIPLVLWRLYIRSYPEGVPASDWLITSVNTAQGLQNIFFRPAFFRWIFFERINNIILGGFATAFLVLGALVRQKRFFLHTILISSLLYVLVFQGGNVQHEYYQTLLFPALSIFVGIGIALVLSSAKIFISPISLYPAVVGIVLFSVFISYYRVKDYYSYSGDLVNIAKIIRTLTPQNGRIVTDSTGDTTLLYLADRKGAPAVYKDLGELKKEGYDYFVTMNGTVIQAVKDETDFQVVFENDKFALFKL